jgi:glycerophosphoryl diester phosphodiesterase
MNCGSCIGVASVVASLLVVAGCKGPETSQQPRTKQAETTMEGADEADKTTELGRPEDFDVQGHRGARGLKPENTLPSFEAALDLEVDTLEMDLHLSQNDQIVVWHDPYVYASKCAPARGGKTPLQLGATTEEERADRAMVRRMPTGHLGQFRCDKNPAPDRFGDQNNEASALAGDDYRIVTLEKVFAFVDQYAQSPDKSESQRQNARNVRFNLETKRKLDHPEYIGDGFDGSGPATFERELVDVIRDHELIERVTVQSFAPESLWAVAELEPELRLAVLEKARQAPLSTYADKGASVWSPKASLVDADAVAEARQAGLQVKPWTVNEPAEMRRLIALGVDGIITDRPDVLIAVLDKLEAAE